MSQARADLTDVCLFSCQHSFLLLFQLPKFLIGELLLVQDLDLANGSSG